MRSSDRMDAQDAMAVVRGLAGFTGRGAGSDAERRAAGWLAARCEATGWEVEVETFWSRPNWALAHLWHVVVAIAGSLIALASPIAGIVLLAVVLVSVTADAISGISLGRRLTPERASQNVIASAPSEAATQRRRTRLVLTANYDAGRVALAYRLKPITSRLTRATRGASPGWIAWLAVAIVWLLVVAILRQDGHTGQLVGALQLPPTVGLLLGFALLLELATGEPSPAAGDNAAGVAAVLTAANALATAPPQHLRMEFALTGAGGAEQIGLRRHLRARPQAGRRPRLRRPARRRSDTIVLAVAASGGGSLHWWQSDGAFLPLRYSPTLRRSAERIAADEAFLQAQPHRGRGNGGALPARAAGLPALTIGCLDSGGTAPRSHRKSDVAESVDAQAVDRTAQFALLLIDAIDAAVAQPPRSPSPTPA